MRTAIADDIIEKLRSDEVTEVCRKCLERITCANLEAWCFPAIRATMAGESFEPKYPVEG